MSARLTRTFFCITLIALCALPLLTHAQAQGPCQGGLTMGANGGCGGFVPLAPVPQGSKLDQIYATEGNFSGFINGLFKFALVVGAIGAVLRLAYAGYLYMGQSDMWSHKGEAKEIINSVVLGLLLLLSIYLILFQINPDILTLNALKNIKPVPQSAAPAQSPQSQAQGSAGLTPDQYFGPVTCPPGQVPDSITASSCVPQ